MAGSAPRRTSERTGTSENDAFRSHGTAEPLGDVLEEVLEEGFPDPGLEKPGEGIRLSYAFDPPYPDKIPFRKDEKYGYALSSTTLSFESRIV